MSKVTIVDYGDETEDDKNQREIEEFLLQNVTHAFVFITLICSVLLLQLLDDDDDSFEPVIHSSCPPRTEDQGRC